jgi:hypothetical protein
MKPWLRRFSVIKLFSLLRSCELLPTSLLKATNAARLVAFFISGNAWNSQPQLELSALGAGSRCVVLHVSDLAMDMLDDQSHAIGGALHFEVASKSPCSIAFLSALHTVVRTLSLSLLEWLISLALAVGLGRVVLALRAKSKDFWTSLRAMRYASRPSFVWNLGGCISDRSCPLPNTLSQRLVMT